MHKELKSRINDLCSELFGEIADADLLRPEEKFGDFSTNAAMKLAKKISKDPREIAERLANELTKNGKFKEVNIAGPGFINLTLKDNDLFDSARHATNLDKSMSGQKIVAEYSDPNPFKVLHVGHLYDSVLGESIANICDAAGAEVHRVNFGGDVGLHVGKTMWAILQKLGGEHPEKLADIPDSKRSEWLTDAYIKGNNVYEDDETAKQEIIELNKRVYQLHEAGDHDSAFAQIYWTTRQWSYDYFNEFYSRIGTKFEKYYPESVTAPVGLAKVKEQLAKGVFEKSDGAVIFNGEVHSLHTRVFINSNGLPTYETKDIGLALCKWKDYKFDRTVILSGNEIIEYMKVVLAALEKFAPEIAKRTKHLPHGMVKMAGGIKMSSRKGNILKAVDVLDLTAQAMANQQSISDESMVQAAVKYAFLKQRMTGDIIFNPKESVSIEGNSGPYLQYACVRAKSILAKAGDLEEMGNSIELDPNERSLARKISLYPEIFSVAAEELSPHHICTYLYELAQAFNRFYEASQVIGDERSAVRLKLVESYAAVLANGLGILGIETPEKM